MRDGLAWMNRSKSKARAWQGRARRDREGGVPGQGRAGLQGWAGWGLPKAKLMGESDGSGGELLSTTEELLVAAVLSAAVLLTALCIPVAQFFKQLRRESNTVGVLITRQVTRAKLNAREVNDILLGRAEQNKAERIRAEQSRTNDRSKEAAPEGRKAGGKEGKVRKCAAVALHDTGKLIRELFEDLSIRSENATSKSLKR
ncbi:unnamed protein product [Calypogeia fissa]